MDTPASRHAQFARTFGETVAATTDWDAPTPVKEWTARDVPAHLIDWLPGFLAGEGIQLDAHDDLPLPERWAARSTDVDALLANPDLPARPITNEYFRGMDVATLIDQLYSPDVYMHTFGLARLQGIRPDMDPAFASHLLEGLREFPGLRESGQFGVEHPTDSDDPVEQLMAFIGRDPQWQR